MYTRPRYNKYSDLPLMLNVEEIYGGVKKKRVKTYEIVKGEQKKMQVLIRSKSIVGFCNKVLRVSLNIVQSKLSRYDKVLAN